MSLPSAHHAANEPWVVRPGKARKLLGDVSNSFFYGTILPQLDSYLEGRARWITTASIREYIAKHLAENTRKPQKPRRGRPRKVPLQLDVQPTAQPEAST